MNYVLILRIRKDLCPISPSFKALYTNKHIKYVASVVFKLFLFFLLLMFFVVQLPVVSAAVVVRDCCWKCQYRCHLLSKTQFDVQGFEFMTIGMQQ